MKPILDKEESKVINFGPSGLDLPLPKSAKGNLKRIRFDGESLVDLGEMNKIYVVYKNNVFELHARSDVPNSQLITMSYSDRRYLKYSNGVIGIKTALDIKSSLVVKLKHRARSKAKIALDKQMGLLVEQFMFNQRLMYVLVWSLRTQNAQGLQFVDTYLTEMGNIFDIADPDFKADLIADYKKIKSVIKNYYKDMGDIEEG
jgi:hypothetical protein